MKTVITNAVIIPMDSSQPRRLTGDIGIEDHLISFVGERPDGFNPDRIIDATGSIVLPGLINAHNHLSMTLLRSYADDMELFSWLHDKIWPVEGRMSEDDIYWGSMLGAAEQIRSGITSFADMYFHQEQTIEAVLSSGMRASVGATFMGDEKATLDRLPATRELHERYNGAGGGRIRVDIAPHAIYTCSRRTLEIITDLALELGTRIHTHISETRREVEECRSEHGLTPPAYLEEIGMLEAPVYGAHCVHLDEDDYRILTEHKTAAIHSPTSNLKLGSGFADVPRWFAEGLRPALGTDGASSNNNLNLFEEMHLASIIHKGYSGDPTAVNAYQVLQMATCNGAAALGIEQVTGTLEAGKEADLIIVSTAGAHLQPLNNPISALVYSAQASDVSHLFCRGELLMDERSLLTIDEEQTMERAQAAAVRLLSN